MVFVASNKDLFTMEELVFKHRITQNKTSSIFCVSVDKSDYVLKVVSA